MTLETRASLPDTDTDEHSSFSVLYILIFPPFHRTVSIFIVSFGKFDESKAQIPADCMRVLYVEPGKIPYETEIPNSLEGEQQAVQGLIDIAYLDHNALLVCNDDGKLIGMDGNRVLDNGTIIAGPFFITGDAGEDFCSLTDEQVAHFMQRFMEPEDISQEDVQADTGFIFYPL